MPSRAGKSGFRLPRWAAALLTVLAIAAAIFLVRHQFAGLTLARVLHAIAATPLHSFVLAALCAAASYASLAATEWYALRVLHQPRPFVRVGPISLAANAITNSTGFGLATGTVLRSRLYRRLDLSLKTVAALVAVSSAANVLSGFATMGLCLLAFLALPAGARPLSAAPAAALGVVLIGVALFGYEAVRLGKKKRGRADRLGPKARAGALLAGIGDWLFSGLALFVLHKPHLAELPEFLLVFTAGSVVGSIVGAPAALGVLDAFVFRFHSHSLAVHETAAGLILYRLIYFVAPLVLAVSGLAVTAAMGRLRSKKPL